MTPRPSLLAATLLLACAPQPAAEGGGSSGDATPKTKGIEGPGGDSSRRAGPQALVVPPPEPAAPKVLEPVGFERLDTPAEIFEHARGALEYKTLNGPAPEPIELRPPSCPHRYAFRVHQGLELLEAGGPKGREPGRIPEPMGLWLAGSWTAAEAPPLPEGASEATLELALGELTLGHVQGHRRPGNSEPEGHFAPIRLRRQPRGWEEVDGPAALWSAYGSWYGLVTFNPGLPERWEPNASSPWELLIHARGSGMRTEVTRGKTELPEGMSVEDLPEPNAQPLEGTAALRGWIELGGTKAAQLVAHAKIDAASEFQIPDEMFEGSSEDSANQARSVFEGSGMSTTGSYDAHFVVLESGQLLHAAIVEEQRVTMRMGRDTEDMVQRHSLVAEARLVESCEGPVMPVFANTATPIEQALEQIVALRNAAATYEGHEPEPQLIEALLSPALAKAVPQASACLIDASTAYGPTVLGTPEMGFEDRYPEAEPGRVIVELATRRAPDGGLGSRDIELRAEFLSIENELRLDALSLRDRWKDEQVLLSLSGEGLSTQLPCAAAAEDAEESAPGATTE